MTKTQAIKYFGTQQKLGEAIGVVQHAVSQWGEHPPPLQQWRIQAATGGALKVDADLRPNKVNRVKNGR